MEALKYINEKILWGVPTLFLMFAAGVYLLVKTRAAVFVHFGFLIKNTIGNIFKRTKTEDGISPFAAASTALAATVGTGNITGVALAIRLGGPGAVFWMWVSGALGMVIKYSEVVLALRYREKTECGYRGGPMYYMQNGLKSKQLAVIFCFCAVLSSFGIGNTVQANAFAGGICKIFNISKYSAGVLLAVLCASVLSGGIRRISSVAEILVPFMAMAYMLAAGIIIIINRDKLISVFGLIAKSAFKDCAPVGGFAGAACGYAVRIGISRGLFTNEAGLGSAPIAHASADAANAVTQGMWGAFEVFFDTIVMCTVTAAVILVTGVWSGECADGALAYSAFSMYIPKGGYIISFALVLFSFASVIAWYHYGETCAEYLFGKKSVRIYRNLYIAACFFGCVSEMKLIWEAADALNAFMLLPNIAALLLLGGEVGKITRDFFK